MLLQCALLQRHVPRQQDRTLARHRLFIAHVVHELAVERQAEETLLPVVHNAVADRALVQPTLFHLCWPAPVRCNALDCTLLVLLLRVLRLVDELVVRFLLVFLFCLFVATTPGRARFPTR